MKAGREAPAERAALRSPCGNAGERRRRHLQTHARAFALGALQLQVRALRMALAHCLAHSLEAFAFGLFEREREIRMRKQRSMPRLSLREGEERSASRTRGATVRAGMQERKCKLLATSHARIYTCRTTLASLRLLDCKRVIARGQLQDGNRKRVIARG